MPNKDFVMASCASKHSFFVGVTGLLYAVGTSNAGELGVHVDQSRYTLEVPVQVTGIPKICDIATAEEHTVAITYDSQEMYGWGNQSNGRLGFGSNSQASVNTPRAIQILKEGNKLRFVAVACGKDFSVAVDIEGSLWFAGVKRYEESTNEYEASRLISYRIQSVH